MCAVTGGGTHEPVGSFAALFSLAATTVMPKSKAPCDSFKLPGNKHLQALLLQKLLCVLYHSFLRECTVHSAGQSVCHLCMVLFLRLEHGLY
jgi:hypothetical protein